MTVVACSGEQLVGSIAGIYTAPAKHDLSSGFSKINVQYLQSPPTRKRKGNRRRAACGKSSFREPAKKHLFQRLQGMPRFRVVITH
jgi:hypothetical protein